MKFKILVSLGRQIDRRSKWTISIVRGMLVFSLVGQSTVCLSDVRFLAPPLASTKRAILPAIMMDAGSIFTRPERSVGENLLEASKKMDPWLAAQLIYQASIRQRIQFSQGNSLSQEETRTLLQWLIEYQTALINLPRDPSNIEQSRQLIQQLQRTAWEKLQNNLHIQDSRLRHPLSHSYSLEGFHLFYIIELPRFMGENGIFLAPESLATVDPSSGKIFYNSVFFIPYIITSVEKPKDLPKELVVSLKERKIEIPDQEITIGDFPLAQDTQWQSLISGGWTGRNVYGTIILNVNVIQRDIEIDSIRFIEQEQKIGRSKLIQQWFLLETDVQEIFTAAEEDQRSALEISRALIWNWYMKRWMRIGQQEVFKSYRKRVRDHELGHYLFDYDPEQQLAKAVGIYQISNSQRGEELKELNAQTHNEIIAFIEELINCDPSEMLYHQAWNWVDTTLQSQHAIGSRWLRDTAIDLILQQGPENFGMSIRQESRFTTREQILIQFVQLAKPDHEQALRKLGRGLKRYHRQIIHQKVFTPNDYKDEIDQLGQHPLTDLIIPVKHHWIDKAIPYLAPSGAFLTAGGVTSGIVFLWKRTNQIALSHFIVRNQKKYPMISTAIKEIEKINSQQDLGLVRKLMSIGRVKSQSPRERKKIQMERLEQLRVEYQQERKVPLGWNDLNGVRHELNHLMTDWRKSKEQKSEQKIDQALQRSL